MFELMKRVFVCGESGKEISAAQISCSGCSIIFCIQRVNSIEQQ